MPVEVVEVHGSKAVLEASIRTSVWRAACSAPGMSSVRIESYSKLSRPFCGGRL